MRVDFSRRSFDQIMKARVLIAIAAMHFLGSDAAFAEEALALAMQACRTQTEGSARLACYEAIVITPMSAARTSGVAAASAAAAAVGNSNVVPFAEASGPSRRLVAADDVQTGKSTLAGPFVGWQSGTKLHLSNGQVWQVVDGSTGVYKLSNVKVRIERGAFGSYFMQIEGVGQTPRVRRVN